jgi:ATP-dependent helicase/nuclease subunit B
MNLQTVSRRQAFEILEKDAVLVTSTRRLSRHLTSLYSRFQLEKKRLVWETPSILPVASWLENCFYSMDETRDKPLLLSGEQEGALWEEIISSLSPEHRFPGLDVISGTASRAMEIIIRHRLPWKEIKSSPDREIKTFVSWAMAFDQACADKNFLTRAGLTGFMTSSLEKSLFGPPKALILAGFYEFDPAQTRLLLSLQNNGTLLYRMDNIRAGARAFKTRFKDFETQVKDAAGHALNLVLEDPGVRVGVVVPGLEAHREKVERIFEHIFHPEAITAYSQQDEKIFNISLGRPLAGYPLARFALVFLDIIHKEKWNLSSLAVILNSPLIAGGNREFPARAALENRLYRDAHSWKTADSVLEMASSEGKAYYCPELVRLFREARDAVGDQDKYQSPAGWAHLFSKLLEISGWPDDRAMNSLEYQTFQAFKEELSRLSRLERVLERINYGGALDKLKSLLNTRVFQAESPQVQVQILGLFEAAGLDFDHLRVMNMSADVLPAASNPNPFLPVDLQRRYNTPGSSPGRELELARIITKALMGSSRETIFSCPVMDEDREVLESPLLEGIPLVDPGKIKAAGFLDVFEPAVRDPGLETVSDDHGLPFTGPFLSGGARAFQDQALCPFKGYAVHRLGARAPQEPVFALTPMDRGSLVHTALMNLWRDIGSLAELKEICAAGSLDSLVNETVSLTVREFSGTGHPLCTPEFMELEQARLKSVIMKWLEKEQQRRDFEVLSLEETREVTINGIRIKTRMDRLDLLENGQVIIIDYKTGSGIDNVKNIWMGERILEPQLPVYSLATREKTAGVVLAQVNPGAFRFHGIISGDEISHRENRLKTPQDLGMPDIRDMSDLLDHWASNLETISLEIKEGLAVADPLPQQGKKTCRYCDLSALCRIRERDS